MPSASGRKSYWGRGRCLRGARRSTTRQSVPHQHYLPAAPDIPSLLHSAALLLPPRLLRFRYPMIYCCCSLCTYERDRNFMSAPVRHGHRNAPSAGVGPGQVSWLGLLLLLLLLWLPLPQTTTKIRPSPVVGGWIRRGRRASSTPSSSSSRRSSRERGHREGYRRARRSHNRNNQRDESIQYSTNHRAHCAHGGSPRPQTHPNPC